MSQKSVRQQREGREAKLMELRASEKKKDRKRKLVVSAVVIVPALILAGLVGMIFYNARTPNVPQALPPSVSEKGGPYLVSTDAPEGAPVLDLYEDFQCPACQQFEAGLGSTITGIAASGAADVRVHMLSFLDGNLGGDASFRAALAAAAADEQGKFLEFHQTLYANQGAEGTGWSDDQLEDWAEAAGVEDIDQWRESFKSGKYEEYVKDVQISSAEDEVDSTPTLLLDGENIRDQATSADALLNLINQAGTPVATEETTE